MTIFNQSGFEARAAYSAEQALEVVAQWQPALALLDVVLPQMSGIDLGILLEANSPSCPVILISGQLATAALVQAAAQAGHDFPLFAKPTPPQDLIAKAKTLLSQTASPPM